MPTTPLTPDLLLILAKPNPSVMGTVRPDGHPVTFPVWYDLEGSRLMVNMTTGRRALTYIHADPRVSLTVIDRDDWYTHISMQGRVVEERDDPDLADIDRISKRYRGVEYIWRIRNRVTMFIEIDRWHGWGAAEVKDVAPDAVD